MFNLIVILIILLQCNISAADEPCNFISCKKRPGSYSVEISPSTNSSLKVYVPSWASSVQIPSKLSTVYDTKYWLRLDISGSIYCYKALKNSIQLVRSVSGSCKDSSSMILEPITVHNMGGKTMQFNLEPGNREETIIYEMSVQ